MQQANDRKRAAWAVGLLLAMMVPAVRGDDWPQWLGPKRDGVWREKGILDKFPPGGPKVLWRTPVGGGYAGPAVADGKVYLMDRQLARGVKNPDNQFSKPRLEGSERVLCLDAANGKQIWKHEYPCLYRISYPTGPRTTPVVAGGKVYTLGAMGDLFCWVFRAALFAATGLSHEVLDRGLDVLLGSRTNALEAVTDNTVVVDQEEVRPRLDLPRLVDGTAGTVPYVAPGEAILFLGRLQVFPCVVGADAQQDEGLAFHRLEQRLLVRDQHHAWAAPTRPEVEQHHLALVIAETQWLAGRVGALNFVSRKVFVRRRDGIFPLPV